MALVGELFCRLVMPLDKKRVRYMATRNIFHMDERNVRFDNELGYVIRPGISAKLNNEEFRTSVSTNSQGFRDDEESLKDPSILMCGDSFGFGWGVNQNSCCDKYLEALSGWHTLNMGVPGYGTLQEFLALKKFADKNNIRGKTVIFLMYPNDVLDTAGYGSGSIKIYDGTISYSNFDLPAFNDLMKMYRTRSCRGIYQSSYLAYLLKNAGKEFKANLRGKKKRYTAPETATVDEKMKYRIFALVIDEIKKFCLRENLKPVFMWIPSVRHYEDGKAKFGNDYEDTVFAEVKDIFIKAGLPLIDLTDRLRHKDYYLLDGHLKPSGQKKMAIRINDFLPETKP